MNQMKRRVKTLEQKTEEKTGHRISFCWVEHGQTEEDAERQWREENRNEEVELSLVSWADETTWPPQKPQPETGPATLSIDDEIEKLYSELEQAGFSRAEVERMVNEGTPLVSEMKVEARPEPVAETEPQPETLQALRADEITRLFRKR